jgi:hypothetical protein
VGFADIPFRLLKVVSKFLGVHLEYAQREAARDASRLAGGLVLLVCAAAIAGAGAIVLSAAAIVALAQYTRLDWLGAILVVGAADAALAVLLGLAGKSRFKAPIMKETRGLVKRTVSSFREA